jgi:hypothetical protein
MSASNNPIGGALIMEFKQIDGQNQRIERVSPTQLVVGIDMATETHVAQATNFHGRAFLCLLSQ